MSEIDNLVAVEKRAWAALSNAHSAFVEHRAETTNDALLRQCLDRAQAYAAALTALCRKP